MNKTIVGNESITAGITNAHIDGNYIRSDRRYPGGDVPALFSVSGIVVEGERIDFWQEMWTGIASCYYLEVGITPKGPPKEEDVLLKSAQILSPVDETHTDYRHLIYRNFQADSPEVTRAMETVVTEAFVEEERSILMAVQKNMAGKNFWGMRPAILEDDRAGIMLRRLTDKLRKSEESRS